MSEYKSHDESFPFNIFVLPLCFGTIITILNIQWMQSSLLLNAPQGDSLVYMTESFIDYWSFKNGDISVLFKKYFVDGNQQASPLLWWLAALSYFLLGLEPINAYLVISAIYLIWIAGVIYLAWCIYPDYKYALACGLMSAFLPSVISHALRNFMLDFVAAAPFIWATAFLLKSDLGFKRGYVIIYSVLCGITVLFRTTLPPYFLSHLIIIVFLALSQKRHPHYGNMLLSVLLGTLICGGFIFPNIGRIFDYYGYWTSQTSQTANPSSFFYNLAFYFNLVNWFHLKRFALITLVTISFLAIIYLIYIYRKKIIKPKQSRVVFNGLIILIPLALVPTTILSFYSSPAATVDYTFIAVYLMVPTLLWRVVSEKPKIFWIGAGIMVLTLGITQMSLLVQSQSRELSETDYREREVIKMILDDAQHRGNKDIVIGNTAIHQHNSLSYKYWIMANYFPSWRGHMDVIGGLGRTDSASILAKMNVNADYVITVENCQKKYPPNNVVAPEANSILQNQYGMVYMPLSFDIPGGCTIRILRK